MPGTEFARRFLMKPLAINILEKEIRRILEHVK
jgi:hypothetical protein